MKRLKLAQSSLLRIMPSSIVRWQSWIRRPPAGRLYEKLIKNDIAVYISHTNLDVADGGINDWLADLVGILPEGRQCLEEVHTDKLYKLVVFVPESHHEQVLEAIWRAGAGQIGSYSNCSFNIKGTGTFVPGPGTNPLYWSSKASLSMRTKFGSKRSYLTAFIAKTVQAMLKAHPYEEVAYDLYAMDLKGRSFGLGRAGKLEQPITLRRACRASKDYFRRSVLFGSSGRLTVSYAKRLYLAALAPDMCGMRYLLERTCLITGDIDYHTAHDALAAGMTIIDPGHNIEKVMKQQGC